ncbi:MAG: branched-chain amino acid ABC transporter permease [Nanoarchaeota archaeon]|nr:branched-chain amino acid ABC transporter permease [DPANN group archaeon]MBL7117107.1 branched-chain amino acid ABC transporter permease [Nanoarchaeota archaeon]
MSLLAQLTVNGLIAGAIYALVAAGFSLIYSTNKFMHFAHGISVVVGAYILYSLFSLIGIPFYLACILTLIFSSLFGLGTYRLMYLPLQNKKASNVVLLIASIGVLILFQNVIQLIFGPDVKSVGYIKVARGLNVFGAIITPLQIVIILISITLFVLLYLFMKKSKLGRDMRAVSDNKELASIMGINHKRIADYSFIIGSFLAGVAGILIGLEQNLNPTMGTILIIKGFTGAVIGGVGFIPGAVLGSFLLGLAENFSIWFLPSGYKDAIAFVLLFIFLLLKPTGLFGINKDVKK